MRTKEEESRVSQLTNLTSSIGVCKGYVKKSDYSKVKVTRCEHRRTATQVEATISV